ncbi:uncharacterized protein KY384_006494 [Bacidia gigantensis]|uniref:uncharacterized protein n=1 Tax=Bacidia gigantensis TaxID=2732470 RepID=UPI001D048C61|nr:uncharacterized protein KY384_006494 [Bacidia gigantensis]KAG8528805.1 hypothetical protein KY384_006494 [Bacidia gigantensis]
MDSDREHLLPRGSPLYPVPPNRMNERNQTQAMRSPIDDGTTPQLSPSPSLPAFSHLLQGRSSHMRGSSDVQGKVAQFNGLAKEAAQRRKDNEAALRRALMGREEAEGESQRYKDENKLLKVDVEEGRGREMKVALRLENIQGELQKVKEAQTHERKIYEKEIRRARKEAFKASSTLVNCQDELKGARNKFTLMREEAEEHRRKKDVIEQEALQAKGELAGLQEEVDALRKRLDIAEQERDTLKMTVNQEDVARMASAGSIALPLSAADDEFSSPRKRRRHEEGSLKENFDPEAPVEDDAELMALREDLRSQKRLRLKAEDEAHFLKMECQFGVCSCRVAEMQGVEYVHDNSFARQIQEDSGKYNTGNPISVESTKEGPTISSTVPTMTAMDDDAEQPSEEGLLTFSPTSGTFSKAPSPIRPEFLVNACNVIADNRPSTPPQKCQSTQSPPATHHGHLPQTPRPLPEATTLQQPPRTVSHFTTSTSTVPLKADDPVFSPAPNTPGGISREEALERIRQRRGRARSFAVGIGGTPGRGSVREGERREISAPVSTGKRKG